MRRAVPALLLALAACALPTGPVPQAARLSAERLTVTLTDGTACTAAWAGRGGGTFEACPGLSWRVAMAENPNLLRRLAEGITLALGGEGVLAPMAEVTVGDGARTWRFVSPPPAD